MIQKLGPSYVHDVGAGWHSLLRWLHERTVKANLPVKYRQVKEKFGTLRIYCDIDETQLPADVENPIEYQTAVDRLDRLIEHVERLSSIICEDCGNPGRTCKPNGKYYMVTICDDCETKLKDTKY